MSAVIESKVLRTAARTGCKISRVDIHGSLSAAEAAWRRLETAQNVSTPYQAFDFLSLWQDHVGTRGGMTPFVAVAYDRDNEPVMVLPLITRRMYGLKIACFPGGKHSNFNMGLWQRDFAQNASQDDIEHIVRGIAGHALAADVLALSQQPMNWSGVQNPFALLPHQPSINACPLLTIDPKAPPPTRISSSFRRRLNGKEKKLKALPGYRYIHAHTVEDVQRLLDMFFAVKPIRMAEQKIRNVFAEPGVEQFIRHACLDGIADKPAIELHGLECDAEVLAIFAGVGDGNRFSTMFNTYSVSEASRNSPGLVLLRHIIDNHAERGCSSFDFGVGTDEYKLQFCKEQRQPLFDSFIPLTARGHAGAKFLSLKTIVKRAIKQSGFAMKTVQLVRQRLG